jgi:hypothetical protein
LPALSPQRHWRDRHRPYSSFERGERASLTSPRGTISREASFGRYAHVKTDPFTERDRNTLAVELSPDTGVVEEIGQQLGSTALIHP